MLKELFVLAVFLVLVKPGFSQKYTAEKTFISFYSHALIEDISAENTKTTTIFNSANGEVVFSVPMKEFQFAKSLMREHFNEKYIESEKYPKSTFQGKIVDFQQNKEGPQEVHAKGKLTIHGVTNEIDVPGTIETQGNKIVMKSKFMVKVADYKITIPQLLFQNIAEEVEVIIDFTYKPM